MQYPILNKKQRQAVGIPVLNGGMNLRDALSDVNDNQLTDCENVWFRDGILKTRPGHGTPGNAEPYEGEILQKKVHDIFSKDGQLVSFSRIIQNTDDPDDQLDIGSLHLIHFYWFGADLQSIATLDLGRYVGEFRYFVLSKNSILYCFVSDRRVFKCDCAAASPAWELLFDSDFYIPLIATNCIPEWQESADAFLSSGNMIEGYNLLSPYYRIICSSSNPNTDIAVFRLPFVFRDCIGKYLTVKITYKTGITYTHSLLMGGLGGQRYETTDPGDGICLGWFSGAGFFFVDSETVSSSAPATHFFKPEDFIKNNMEIIAPYQIEESQKQKIFNMTLATWFGGSNAGLNGGTRAFLGGNTTPGQENLVIWSGLNDPLYFDENNYFYVGTDSSPVTQFGKQSDMLVIFKPNETYYTQYMRNTNITADDLINQNVVDYTANAVYFPLTLINATIGCDCPDTVQLCRNRLVWAHTGGKVYSLVTADVYNERTIYEVGGMIERELRNVSDMETAVSADFEDHYLLAVGNTVYVMDYNSSGYQYPYSFNKAEDANKSVPWYRWRLDKAPAVLAPNGNRLAVFYTESGGSGEEFCYSVYSDEHETDDAAPIESMIQTKLFDFLQGYRKNVEIVGLSIGNNGGAPVTVTYVTDCGEEADEIVPDGEEDEQHAAGYVMAFRTYPCIRSVLRFGVRLECAGSLAVDGINMQYKILGGAR